MDCKTWTVALRNSDLSTRNIQIALDNAIWGMKNAGIHKNIKAGDKVVFLIGVSIDNIEDLRSDAIYSDPKNVFPNYKNEILSPSFVEKFKFKVDRVLFGTIVTDFFIDDSEVWPPKEDEKVDKKTGAKVIKKNYFANRFGWTLTHQTEDLLLAVNDSNLEFHSNVIKALRSKRVEPSNLSSIELDSILSKLSQINPVQITEEDYQNSIENAKPRSLKSGPQDVPNKSEGNGTSSWKRLASVARLAIEHADFLCENDPDHLTFTSKKTERNFVEAHHLIPMEKQGEFDVSLDVPENILSLCPNCHRMFHHAQNEHLPELLSKFYEKRHKALKERAVHIDLNKLVEFYVS